jgi:DNA-binding LytR/AlgR family response regulator
MEQILIVEDEELAAKKLIMLLQKIAPTFKVAEVLGSVSASVEWLSVNDPDLIFLDIHLADDVSFRIFEQTEVKAPVIFVTAYDQFAIKAFKNNGIDYILKPIDEEDLRKGIVKYQNNSRKGQLLPKGIQQLIDNYPPIKSYKSRILVSYGEKIKSVPTTDIAFFYSFEKGVYLTTFSNITYLADDTLDTLENGLDPTFFFRLNRKFIININSIKEVLKYSTRQFRVVLEPSPKFETIVPSDKITSFKTWLNI